MEDPPEGGNYEPLSLTSKCMQSLLQEDFFSIGRRWGFASVFA